MSKPLVIVRKRLIWDFKKLFSTTTSAKKKHCCKLLIVGGGDAGCITAAKFTKILHKHEIIVVEPEEIHYYQPFFTFIGAGVAKLRDLVRPKLQVLPQNIIWLRDSVQYFCPNNNTVILKSDDAVEYDVMVIAIGIQLDLDKVIGLREALQNYRNVSTIFSPKYVEKTFTCIKEYVGGTAIFTTPSVPTKCFAAGYKICFLFEDYLKKNAKPSEADITFTTGSAALHPIPIYNTAINRVVKRKSIDLHLQTNLIEVKPEQNEAVFECLKKPGTNITLEYSMLHVTPPMSPPDALKNCKDLVNASNLVDADLHTLQHKKFPNIYTIGDCGPGTANKTLNAIFPQAVVILKNVSDTLDGKKPEMKYDGYTACPVVTGYSKCILTEFDYDLKLRESLPFRQDIESRIVYLLKVHVFPKIYWHIMLKGMWNGTSLLRNIYSLQFYKDGLKKFMRKKEAKT